MEGYTNEAGPTRNESRDYGTRDDAPILPNGNATRLPSPQSLPNRLSSYSTGSSYVELMAGSVPCPTCRGVGNIPKEQEGELVALIPLKDDRLKPRRTFLYVGIAVFVCLLAGGLLLFFLMPRNVTIQSDKPLLLPQNLTINKQEKYVSFRIVNRYNLTNSNYITVTLENIQMAVMFNTKVLNSVTLNNTMTVPMRSQTALDIPMKIVFNKDNGLQFMADVCSYPNQWYYENIMVFQTTVQYSYLGHTEEATLGTYQYVSCGNYTSPVTTVTPHVTDTSPVTTVTPSVTDTTISTIPVDTSKVTSAVSNKGNS